MNGIFISYRRGETGSHVAGRISQCLGDRYGADLVFFDVQDIRPGHHFDKQIDDALRQCHAFLVVIDNQWVSAEQLRRLFSPSDFVRREIETALGRDVSVIPLLIDDAIMPSEESLPDCLRAFSVCQAIHLRHATFDIDISQLFAELDRRYAELDALRNAMPCPHCHTAIKISPGERLVSCPSCEKDVGVLSVILNDSAGPEIDRKLSGRLKIAAIDFANERYEDAYNQYSQVLESSPECWEALTNKAVCLFWLGTEDLEHLPEVFGLLEKAELLSNHHPKVRAIRRSLAYNLAALANAEEMIGSRISWSLDLFEFCRKLEDDDSDRDELIDDYVKRCFNGIQKRLVELLVRDRKDFDPPLAELATLNRLIQLRGAPDVLKFFSLMARRKLQTSGGIDSLHQELESAEEQLALIEPESPPLRIVFPFIGEPKIEEA